MTISNKLRYLLTHWQRYAIESLDKQFLEQLKVVDDVLLEFGNKAKDINAQNHYFDAQREIHPQKKSIYKEFHKRLSIIIKAFPKPVPVADEAPADEEKLSLVNLDLYERNLAIHTLSDRVERKNYQLLYLLAQRLSVINAGQPVKIADIPASPKQMGEIFIHCTDQLNIENDARLLLCTLYDKFILSKLTDIHQRLNDDLIAGGILPNLKYKPAVSNTPETAKDNKKEPHKASAAAANAGDAIPAIQAMMTQQRRVTRPAVATSIPKASDQEVVDVVNRFIGAAEQQYPGTVQLGEPISDDQVSSEDLHQIKQTLKTSRTDMKQDVGVERLRDDQENVIDLVGMLFEQMLDDQRIPDMAKALFGHLHTPYIKIGLEDPSFLVSEKNAARVFLDNAIEASAFWMDESKPTEGIYPFLKDIVFRIVRLQHQERQHFKEYIGLLEGEIARLKDKFSILEKHSRNAEQGRELMSRAKIAAKNATEKIFAEHDVPRYSTQFIDQVWIDYLTLLYLRESGNHEGDAWKSAQKLGAKILSISQQALKQPVEKPQLDPLAEMLWTQVGELLPHKGKEIERFIRALSSSPADATVLGSDKEQKKTSSADENKINKKLQEKLKNLPADTLFEFNRKKGRKQRARLSWYNSVSHRFMFVNSRGKKTALLTLAELTEGIEQGNIVYFDDAKTSFWNRALSAIRRLLEKNIREITT